MNTRSQPARGRRIGVLSDTHGPVREAVFEFFRDVEMIIHAGDIGGPQVLEGLRALAPVVAVRGNMDTEPWSRALPESEVVEIDRSLLYVLHDEGELDLDPAAAGFQAIITGHTHRPSLSHRNGILFLNPGSAGPRRFKLPVSVAILEVSGQSVEARLVELRI
jgi:putative phosphoesterase